MLNILATIIYILKNTEEIVSIILQITVTFEGYIFSRTYRPQRFILARFDSFLCLSRPEATKYSGNLCPKSTGLGELLF